MASLTHTDFVLIPEQSHFELSVPEQDVHELSVPEQYVPEQDIID